MKRQNVVTNLAARRRRPKPVGFTDEEQATMRRLARDGYGPSAIATYVKRARDAVNIWLNAQGFYVREGRRRDGSGGVITLPNVDGVDT